MINYMQSSYVNQSKNTAKTSLKTAKWLHLMQGFWKAVKFVINKADLNLEILFALSNKPAHQKVSLLFTVYLVVLRSLSTAIATGLDMVCLLARISSTRCSSFVNKAILPDFLTEFSAFSNSFSEFE
jgi:hypothetical protein